MESSSGASNTPPRLSNLLRVESDITRKFGRVRSNQPADHRKLTWDQHKTPRHISSLKGVHYTSKFTKDGFDEGIDNLNQVPLNPDYSLAYGTLR